MFVCVYAFVHVSHVMRSIVERSVTPIFIHCKIDNQWQCVWQVNRNSCWSGASQRRKTQWKSNSKRLNNWIFQIFWCTKRIVNAPALDESGVLRDKNNQPNKLSWLNPVRWLSNACRGTISRCASAICRARRRCWTAAQQVVRRQRQQYRRKPHCTTCMWRTKAKWSILLATCCRCNTLTSALPHRICIHDSMRPYSMCRTCCKHMSVAKMPSNVLRAFAPPTSAVWPTIRAHWRCSPMRMAAFWTIWLWPKCTMICCMWCRMRRAGCRTAPSSAKVWWVKIVAISIWECVMMIDFFVCLFDSGCRNATANWARMCRWSFWTPKVVRWSPCKDRRQSSHWKVSAKNRWMNCISCRRP